jgi:hypothetical protein
MSDRINVHEVLQLHPELLDVEDQQQIKLNHPNCSAGRDTKSRLFVKRDGELLLLYCHHCGCKGVHSTGRRSYIKRRQHNKVVRNLYLPRDFTTDPAECHVLANVWYNKYGITLEEREHYQLGWSDTWKRAILPIWQGGELVAFQARRLLPQDDGPKYLTRKLAGWDRPFFTGGWGEHLAFDTMAVVEDILSAIKVGRLITTTAILNATFSDEMVKATLRYNPERVVVWLDDDNPAVRQSQRRIMRRIAPYANVSRITGVGKDPKELDEDQIGILLRGAT